MTGGQVTIRLTVPEAVVLDARSEKRLGGTGKALPWNDLAVDLARDRGSSAVVLAGGLKPTNVVDVSRDGDVSQL